jgi:hypothetical protein
MGTESNSVEQEGSHGITTWEVDKEWLAQMEKRIFKATPQLLSISAGRSSCCIFRVPQSLININGKQSYQPRIVSIGPYHRGQPNLQMTEEHKWWYLRSLLSMTKEKKGITLEDYLKSIHPLEKVARECYLETIHLGTNDSSK